MKYLIFSPAYCSFLSPAAITQVLDNALEYAAKGHEVTLVYCDNSATKYCLSNTGGSAGVCSHCRRYMHNLLASKPVRSRKNLRLTGYKEDAGETVPFSYGSIEDIKAIKYKGVGVGFAAYSTFLSTSRNMYPRIDEGFRKYFDRLLQSACRYTDFVLKMTEEINPDVICGLNSRAVYSRPVWDITRQKGIRYECWEGVYDRKSQYCKISFGDSTPHDPLTNKRMVEETWSDTSIPEAEKMEVGEDFYRKRRNSIPAGDKLYVKDQVQGMLPQGFDPSKHNILILNSSEDEYAALFENYLDGVPFKTQYPGIKYIAEALRNEPGYQLYLRIHPNLKSINYLYHTKLYELAKANPNLTVIAPDSPVSTYGLIDACEKVLVFGSTTGPEAAYWGKPVILMYNCVYSLLDICYTPHTPEEVMELIKTPGLPPKDRLQAIKFGYFSLNDNHEPYRYFHPFREHKDMLGRSFDYHRLSDVGPLRSRYLILLQTAGKYFYYKHLNFPQEEDPALYE